jgi:hypothetical protein
MNAVERLEAAITKLETLKGSSSPGVWATGDDGDIYIDRESIGHFRWFANTWNPDADLIVTLHRTIDAQLAILRHVRAHFSGDLGISTNRHVVALADAILGGDQ